MRIRQLASIGALALCVHITFAAEPTPEARIAAERLRDFAAGAGNSPTHNLAFVYFTPSDREPPAGYRERLGRMMKDIQRFYGNEMERHGLGRRSISFDSDSGGALIVHAVKGRKPAADYLGRDFAKGGWVVEESQPALKAAGIEANKATVIYFCNLRTEKDGRTTGIGPYYGSGAQSGAFRFGNCLFTDATILDPDRLGDKSTMLDDEEYGRISAGRYNSIFIGGAAHELGHALGLPHDLERKDESGRGTSLMGSGNRTYGEERRGEGRGSFLTLADALRLASHPMFSGTDRDLDVRPECHMEDVKAEERDDRLEISGRVAAAPGPYALIAYNDPFPPHGEADNKGWHDYDSTATPALLDATNHFTVSLTGFKAGERGIRLVVCHLNGATSLFHYSLHIHHDGKPDGASFKQTQ